MEDLDFLWEPGEQSEMDTTGIAVSSRGDEAMDIFSHAFEEEIRLLKEADDNPAVKHAKPTHLSAYEVGIERDVLHLEELYLEEKTPADFPQRERYCENLSCYLKLMPAGLPEDGPSSMRMTRAAFQAAGICIRGQKLYTPLERKLALKEHYNDEVCSVKLLRCKLHCMEEAQLDKLLQVLPLPTMGRDCLIPELQNHLIAIMSDTRKTAGYGLDRPGLSSYYLGCCADRSARLQSQQPQLKQPPTLVK
ncbi:hypothetical protein B484DRAFT_424637 [Ochromonadaceae sp. CCMP2298]|nr:hypothetical protein B484DRAFT_424637 [Ochromonadaceae sp. CCMP2298]